MEINSHKMNFDQVVKNGRDALLIYDDTFYKITSINEKEFIARKGKLSFQNKTMFLHAYGKTGTYKNFGKEVPFFIFKKVPRKDTPKILINGTDYDKIITNTILSLRSSNLTTHIVQIGDTKDGGFVTFDNTNTVNVKLKNGNEVVLDKDFLHFEKVHYTKKSYKKLWFKYLSGKSLPYDETKLTSKDVNAFSKYKELNSRLDKDYEKLAYKSYSKNKLIKDEMNRLWDKLTPSQKRKVSK